MRHVVTRSGRSLPVLVCLLGLCVCLFGIAGCKDKSAPAPDQADSATRAPIRQPLIGGPAPALLMTQAQFATVTGPDGKKTPVPGPAKLVIVRHTGGDWVQSVVEDPDSNVFHKAIVYDLNGDGVANEILTIGAVGAHLKVWRFDGNQWTEKTLLSRKFGGKTDRFRDIEIGDVDADGKPEAVLATHDQGVVLIVELDENNPTATQIDAKPDTFVHEIELGDIDGDGQLEIFATPSHPNRASLESQPGEVAMYKRDPATGEFKRSTVDTIDKTHVKEILAVDLNGDGVATLFSVLEAVTRKDESGKTAIVEPVEIRQYKFAQDGTATHSTAATLNDRQCRFLTPGDLDGDGAVEIAAAGWKSGLWLLDPAGDGTWEVKLIDASSSGYEHTALATDLDGDGTPELYVASDEQGELRQYKWNGSDFSRTMLVPIGRGDITWNLMPAHL